MRSRPAARHVLFFVLCLTALAPEAARANGNNSHLGITIDARERLPDGDLKELLSRPEVQSGFQNGASFPDGGYVVQDDYGEIAHWEPFVEAYMRWIRAHYSRPYAADPEAALHVAFLMGIASHGMGDQVYDSLFMAPARVHDAEHWSDETLHDFDTATDVLYVVATQFALDPEAWVPADDLVGVFHDELAYEVSASTLDSAQRFLRGVRHVPRDAAADPTQVAEYEAQYPWAATYMMDETVAGGPLCEGAVVSAYLRSVWDRLNGEKSLENLVIATSPSAGASVASLDATLVESQLGIVFGVAVDDTSLGADTVTVSDASGTPLAVEASMWRTESNVMRLRPLADWPADTTLTVTLHAGLRTIDGMVLDADWSFEVSTAPAAAGQPLPGQVDPTPNKAEPDPGQVVEDPPTPETNDDGGCRVGQRGSRADVSLVALAFAGAFVWRRRRATSKASASRRS